MSKEIYFETAYNEIPRILSLLDRSIGSPTYGCFDRNFWQYRIIDFSSARCQEAVLTLALIYGLKRQENTYFNNPVLLDWINATLNFWCSIQEKNGSFNEWYPKENSFVATAFSSYAISETLLLLEGALIDRYDRVIASLKGAGDWLIPKTEGRVANQTAGAAIALFNISLLTKENKYLSACQKKIEFLEAHQDSEGWFMEYGGADIGYLSLTVDYLSKYYAKTDDQRVLKILEKAVSFIFNFTHPDYTFGGPYASRGTEYIVPSGFEIMASRIEKSQIISGFIREALKNKSTIIPASLDDRYASYMAYNYLQAYLAAGDSRQDYPCSSLDAELGFDNLGIKIFKKPDLYLVCNYKKGGVFKLINKNSPVEDWGVILESDKGNKYFSGWLNPEAVYQQEGGNSFLIKTYFQEIKKIMPDPLKLIASRLIQLTIGLNQNLGIWIKNKFRDIVITRKQKTPISLTRGFKFEEKKIIITDTIEGAQGIINVILGAKVSYIFVPSSCFFSPSDLKSKAHICKLEKPQETVIIRREFDMRIGTVKVNVS